MDSAKVAAAGSTLWGFQCDVRHRVEKLYELLVCAEPQETEKAQPVSIIGDMIEYEEKTLRILEGTVEQAERLRGK